MSERAQMFGRLVVKVGASVLTDTLGKPHPQRLEQVVEQVAACVAQHRQMVLVSSGAIACGMAAISLKRRPSDLIQLQMCAAIGQGQLMRLYSEAFSTHGLTVAQVLLTEADLTDRRRCDNAKHTLQALIARRIVPIVNENDAVAVEEIAFGDNDRLAALVACVLDAHLLVMLSDVDGLLDNGHVIERIDTLNHTHRALALGPSRETTMGGMASKLAAARIARHSGIPMVIANGTKPGILLDLLEGKPVGTMISPPQARLKFRKWWIAFAARQPTGSIVIDGGAVEAIVHRGKSLLPSGIKDVRGRFLAGEAITIVDETHHEVARGLSNFSSHELLRIRGLKSQQIADTLGPRTPHEAVHRDNLVLTQELH